MVRELRAAAQSFWASARSFGPVYRPIRGRDRRDGEQEGECGWGSKLHGDGAGRRETKWRAGNISTRVEASVCFLLLLPFCPPSSERGEPCCPPAQTWLVQPVFAWLSIFGQSIESLKAWRQWIACPLF